MSRRRFSRSDAEVDGHNSALLPSGDSDEIEWVELTARRSDLDLPEKQQSSRPAVLLGAFVLAGLMLMALFGSAGEAPDRQADDDVAEPSPDGVPLPEPTRPGVVTESLVVRSAPDDWLDGYVLAWASPTQPMRVANAIDGSPIDTQQWSTLVWPISPEASFFGTANNTWVVDPANVAQSGQMANTAQLVRLGPDLDRYAFVTDADDRVDFYVGSLWGAAGTGLTEAPVTSTIFGLPDTGVIISNIDGTSRAIDKVGVRDLPSRLGRVVAASPSRLVGSFCDDLARCVGRVQDWDGLDEQQVDVSLVSSPSVHISPDGALLSSSDSTTWSISDLNPAGVTQTQMTRISPPGSARWSSDGNALVWLEGSEVRMARPAIDGFTVHSIGWTAATPSSDLIDAQVMLVRTDS